MPAEETTVAPDQNPQPEQTAGQDLDEESTQAAGDEDAEFDAAFDQNGGAPADGGEREADPSDFDAPGGDAAPPSTPQPGPTPAAAPSTPADGAGAPPAAPPDAAPAPAEPTPEELLEAERQEILAMRAQADQREQEYQAKHGQPLRTEAEVQDQEELDRSLEDVRRDLPDVDRVIRHYVETGVAQALAGLEPVVTDLQRTIGALKFELAVQRAHPDFYDIRDDPKDLEAWIKSLPLEQGRPYDEAYQRGNAQNVTQLLTDYKKARGIAVTGQPRANGVSKANGGGSPAPAPAAAVPPRADPKRKAQLEAAEAVPSRGSPIPVDHGAQGGADDFDRGFDRSAAQ